MRVRRRLGYQLRAFPFAITSLCLGVPALAQNALHIIEGMVTDTQGQPVTPSGTYRVVLQVDPDPHNADLRSTQRVILDLEPRPIPLDRAGTDAVGDAIRWDARRIPLPNACFYEEADSSVPHNDPRAGLAHWSMDPTRDSVVVLMEVGVDNGLSIRFLLDTGVLHGRLHWWGMLVLSRDPSRPGGPGTVPVPALESAGVGAMPGRVTAVRRGSPDFASCITAVRQVTVPRPSGVSGAVGTQPPATDSVRVYLPRIFTSALRQVKAQSHIPVLLPSELPEPIGEAKQAVIQAAVAGMYSIALYYELDIGDAGFAATFVGKAAARTDDPQGFPNVHVVGLAHGVRGFFRAVSCGGSCAPANLWWQESGILYQVQVKPSPTLSASDQEGIVVRVANSAILAGPR